tara:strand:- start:252 stop:458 length:207 start_codon:yes stop_codon:yes gene_type:complete
MSKKRNQHLKVLLLQYAQSILEMADSITTKNVNQVVSLIKANITVLENDVKESFNKHNDQDFNDRVYN